MKFQKGGIRWKEGADTCVFKPSVACKEDPETYPSNIPSYVSRIVKSSEPDVETETLLRTHHKDLIRRGFLASAQVICTPEFIDSNLSGSISPRGPCSQFVSKNIGVLYSNLITAEYTDSFRNYLYTKRPSIQEAIILLRGAITAAIDLVPDAGPWIIHGDLHLGNVLIKKEPGYEPYTGLGDWGRAIVISDPKNIDSVYNGLIRYLVQMSALFGPFTTFSSTNLADTPMTMYPPIASGRLAQYSLTVLDSMQAVLKFIDDHNLILKEGMNRIRGWMVYALFKQVFGFYGKYPPPWALELLDQPSQEALRIIINQEIPMINGQPFLSKAYTTTKVKIPIPPITSPVNIAANYGGKRRTKKQKQKRKTRKN